ncbi:MAG: DNA-processing protein DprA, partial [Limnobacter sp.]|nr:DNA-processing protein DprA [Limnobacter sp.]
MTHNQELVSHLTVALHPELSRRQKAELAQTALEFRVLPKPTDPILHWVQASQQWLGQGQGDRHLLFPLHPKYPRALLDLKDPPLILFAQGNLSCLSVPAVAMVGSRSASRSGLALARDFARELAQQGWCITSGLAEGIDGASHEGALEGEGCTIGILGGAIDRLYPRAHQRLADQMCSQGGLVLSEYPPGTDPRPAFFPQRNRLIAALSEATLVVEAAKRSGSLITARLASELGRTVMALPGSIHSPH